MATTKTENGKADIGARRLVSLIKDTAICIATQKQEIFIMNYLDNL